LFCELHRKVTEALLLGLSYVEEGKTLFTRRVRFIDICTLQKHVSMVPVDIFTVT